MLYIAYTAVFNYHPCMHACLLIIFSLFLCVLATPADVGLLMQLGVDGVFVGSGIFKSSDPAKRAKAMVQAVSHFNDPKILAEVSEDLGEPMVSWQANM